MSDELDDTVGAADVGNEDETDSGYADWERAHQELSRLAKNRAGLDFEEGQWLVRGLRAGAHVRLGFGTFAEYTARLFGYSPRLTFEKLRVAEALEELPELARALHSGELSWSAVRELTRVAIPNTEGEWLAAARGRTVRDIEKLVSGHKPGNRPSDTPDPALRRHVLRHEVSGETLAMVREAMAKIRRDSGGPLDDDAALLSMARLVLGGPKDSGRASYQIRVSICDVCKRGAIEGKGELVAVGPEIVEMAECDAQHIGHGHTSVGERTAHVGTSEPTARPGEPTVGACESTADSGKAQPSPRATQTIPPATRREVVRRDGGRCIVPGCRSAVFLDLHTWIYGAKAAKTTRTVSDVSALRTIVRFTRGA
jgi:hypothetical protein